MNDREKSIEKSVSQVSHVFWGKKLASEVCCAFILEDAYDSGNLQIVVLFTKLA